MYNSCVNNGASGFQLDYLLRERQLTNETSLTKKDKFITNKNCHITAKKQWKDFNYYIIALLENYNKYFPNLRKPLIHQTYDNDIGQNKYSSIDHWILLRTIQFKKQEINEETYNKELAYYKIDAAKKWFSYNTYGDYPQILTNHKGIEINKGWNNNIFNYTKCDHDVSIFFNNEGINDIPYITNYYILQYTTARDSSSEKNNNLIEKYDYSIVQGNNSLMDQNHGALDGNQYHLLNTHLFDAETNQSLTQYFKKMNYILKYGEFQFPNDDPLNRWGGQLNYTRNYLGSALRINIENVEVDNSFSKINKKTKRNSELILEYENKGFIKRKDSIEINTATNISVTNTNVLTVGDTVTATKPIISKATKRNVKKTFVDRLLPKINDFLKDDSNNKHRKIKADILNVIKRFRKDNLEIITNNKSTLSRVEPDLLSLIDLTEDESPSKRKKLT
jgi:hypothetical protein